MNRNDEIFLHYGHAHYKSFSHFGVQIAEQTTAFPSEHKKNRYEIVPLPVYFSVPETGTKMERNDCVPVSTGPLLFLYLEQIMTAV